jgi:rhodanese-related sulfurtransferase
VNAIGEQEGMQIEPAQLAAWLQRQPPPQLIDVRETYEREAGYIEDSRHIALAQLTAEAGTLAQDEPVVFYCRVGSRSQMAAEAFKLAGFDAYTLTGGLIRWVAEGMPLVPEGGYVADH